MIVYLARDIRPFVMYCVNGKPRSSLLIESTDSMIIAVELSVFCLVFKTQPGNIMQNSVYGLLLW